MAGPRLEDFSRRAGDAAPPPVREPDPMGGYDTGYQAGWDDAMASTDRDRTHIGAEFQRNLQELGFTFHEARAQVSASVRPLLDAMIAQVLPGAAARGLVDHLWAILEPEVETLASARITLRCASADEAVLSELLAETTVLPVDLAPEPGLLSGQVSFRLGPTLHEIDMAGLIARISALIEAHFAPPDDTTLPGTAHG